MNLRAATFCLFLLALALVIAGEAGGMPWLNLGAGVAAVAGLACGIVWSRRIKATNAQRLGPPVPEQILVHPVAFGRGWAHAVSAEYPVGSHDGEKRPIAANPKGIVYVLSRSARFLGETVFDFDPPRAIVVYRQVARRSELWGQREIYLERSLVTVDVWTVSDAHLRPIRVHSHVDEELGDCVGDTVMDRSKPGRREILNPRFDGDDVLFECDGAPQRVKRSDMLVPASS